MPGAGAGGSARLQSASIAVTATVIVMLITLGFSIAATFDEPQASRTAVAARASQSRPAADAASATTTRRERRASRPPAGPPTTVAEAQPALAAPETGTVPPAHGPPPTTDGPTTGTVGSSGHGQDSPADGSPVAFRPAEPGDWWFTVTTTGDSLLLDESQPRASEMRLAVTEPEDGTQRVTTEHRATALIAETVHYDHGGRRALEFDMWTGSDDLLTFRSTAGFLDLPASFRKGDSWRWAAATDDRQTSLDVTVRLIDRRTQTFATDRETDAIEYEVSYALGGDRSGSISRHVWFSPEIGLPIRVEERLRVDNPDGTLAEWTRVLELMQPEPSPRPVIDAPGGTTSTSGAGRS